MRWDELQGRRVGILGFGREGQAALRALRARFPGTEVTVFDELPVDAAGARVVAGPLDAAALAECEVLIRSPGVSPYRRAVQAALAAGCRVTSGSSLWLAEPRSMPVVAVTGTKGKSTVTALAAHLVTALGRRPAVGGNIGVPLLELALEDADVVILELSSYQVADLSGGVEVALLNNLFPEHLDWHGGEARYYRDKCRLLTLARTAALVNGACGRSLEETASLGERRRFNHAGGWQVRDRRAWFRGRPVGAEIAWSLRGRHNEDNLAAALAVIAALGLPAAEALGSLASFRGLPHRQRVVAERGGICYVDDSLATTPHATLAALDAFRDRPVAVIVGGHDRGLDWRAFARRLAKDPVRLVLVRGANRSRIEQALAELAPAQKRHACEGLGEAVEQARAALEPEGGYLLLSPGAPSFGEFRDYRERGERFARLVRG